MPTLRNNEKTTMGKTHNAFMRDSQHFQTNNYSTGGGNRNLTLKQLKDIIDEIY